MGVNDSVINTYLFIPEIFADLFNGLVFGGEEIQFRLHLLIHRTKQ